MKTTLSYNRQHFNVKELAQAGLTPADMQDNTLGIIDVATNQTVLPGSFDELPKKFRLVHKFDGQVFYGFDCIEKKDIAWTQAKEYKEAKLNKWEGVIKHCRCIDVVRLNILVQSDELNRTLGLTYGALDGYVEVSPAEFECFCSCNEAGAYANNVLTMLLYKKIVKANSPHYTASVETVGGRKFNSLKEVEEFVAQNKAVNTNKDSADDGELLKLVLEAKPCKQTKRFNPYNPKFSYPSGTRLLPGFDVNSGTYIEFKEVQPMEFEVGNGLDLVVDEYDNISYWKNDFQRNMDIVEFPELQFEETKKYDTFTMEFDTPKVNRAGDADKKRFMFIFGSEKDLRSQVFDKLKAIFTRQ